MTNPNQPVFKLFSGALKAYTDKTTGKRRVRCTASSTVEDLHGDEIDVACVASMASQAVAKGMTIFLNHEYKVPEDIFGRTIHAQAQKSGIDPRSAKDVWDLELETELNESNPRALETFNAIEGGITVGVSIGAMIRDWAFRDEKKQWEGGLLIKDVELLEASMVGIPANPRSWVKQAARQLRKTYKTDDVDAPAFLRVGGSATDEAIDIATESEDDDIIAQIEAAMTVGEAGPEVVVKAPLSSESRGDLPDSAFACPAKRKYPHHTSSGAVDKSHLRNALSRCGDASNDQCGCGHIKAHAAKLGIGDNKKSFEELLTFALHDDFDESHFELEADENTENEPETQVDPEAFEDDITPDNHSHITDTKSVTDDESEAEAKVDDEETTSTVDLEAAKSIVGTLSVAEDQDPLLGALLGIVESAAAEVTDLRAQLSTQKALADSVTGLTAERDQARADLDEAMEVLQLMAKAPLARKATLRSVITDRAGGLTQRLANGPYDARFLQLIDKSTEEND